MSCVQQIVILINKIRITICLLKKGAEIAMMEFDALKGEESVMTENGALGYKTTNDPLLDASFKIPALRKIVCNNPTECDLWDGYFKEAFEDDPERTLRYILYLRDIRGGLGERDIFRNLVINMVKYDEALTYGVLSAGNISKYGRWDDIIEIAFSCNNKVILDNAIKNIQAQLNADIKNMHDEKAISLLAKWMPSENASSEITRRRARYIAKTLGITVSSYRKELSQLRKYLGVIERKMSLNKWDTIDYNAVPSKANLIYNKAFIKHDTERRAEYLSNLQANTGNAKINGGTLSPYEIINKYLTHRGPKPVTELEALWKALPKPKKQKNVLVVRDGSYSMYDYYNTVTDKVLPITIADAITLYMSENNTGSYKNKFITFSKQPSIIDVSTIGDDLYSRIKYLSRFNDYTNTNLEAVFKLVQDTIVNNNISEEDIPDILIISDMEFDRAIGQYEKGDKAIAKLLNVIINNWRLATKCDPPKLIFWNVASRTNAIPVKENKNGVILVSGFSPYIANMVLDNEIDPSKALDNQIYIDRYNEAKDILVNAGYIIQRKC